MKEKWEEFKTSLTDIVMMSKKEFLLTATVCILGGIVIGLFFSPKKSIMIASNNGNNNGNGSGNDNNCADEDEESTATDKCEEEKVECKGKKARKCRKSRKKAKDGIVDWNEVEEKELGAEV